MLAAAAAAALGRVADASAAVFLARGRWSKRKTRTPRCNARRRCAMQQSAKTDDDAAADLAMRPGDRRCRPRARAVRGAEPTCAVQVKSASCRTCRQIDRLTHNRLRLLLRPKTYQVMNTWNEAASVFSILDLQSRQAEGASTCVCLAEPTHTRSCDFAAHLCTGILSST